MFTLFQRGLPTVSKGGCAATGQGARRRVQPPLSDQINKQRRRHGRLKVGLQGPQRAREGIEEEDEEKQLR